MSRIGKKAIEIPKGVSVNLTKTEISVKGPKGVLSRKMPPNVDVKVDESSIVIDRLSKERRFGAFQGLARSLIANMVLGVTEGFEKKLQIEGVGYRVALQGSKLVFNLGFSKPV